MQKKYMISIIAVLLILVLVCVYKFNMSNSNDNTQDTSSENGSENSENNAEEYSYELYKDLKYFPEEPLLIENDGDDVTISVEDFMNMLHFTVQTYGYVENFRPQQYFIFNDNAYIFFETGGGNHSGIYLLIKFNLNDKKVTGFLKLPRQNIYLNNISFSPSSENISILSAYTDLSIHFDESSKLNLFISIVNLHTMSVNYTFKFETYSINDISTYDFKWIDDNNLKIDLFDENGDMKSELLNIEYISY